MDSNGSKQKINWKYSLNKNHNKYNIISKNWIPNVFSMCVVWWRRIVWSANNWSCSTGKTVILIRDSYQFHNFAYFPSFSPPNILASKVLNLAECWTNMLNISYLRMEEWFMKISKFSLKFLSFKIKKWLYLGNMSKNTKKIEFSFF